MKVCSFWKDFQGEFVQLGIGDKVEFSVGENDEGRCARDVKIISEFHLQYEEIN